MDWINHKLYIEPIATYIDPIKPVKSAIITHGHADHARAGHEKVLATPQTIQIMKERYGENCARSFQALDFGKSLKIADVEITLYPAGHILGSAQVLITYKGQRVVATGDYKTRPDNTAQNFELVRCDTFITEATFGLPVFRHPDAYEETKKLLASVKANSERCHVVGAYALGKTQRVIKLLRDAGYDAPIYIHGANKKLCAYYQSEGVDLGDLRSATVRPEDGKKSGIKGQNDSLKGQIVLAPPSALKDRWSRRLPDPIICYASGWMSVKQRARQSLVELPLVISDHVDWNELTDIIPQTGAENIWVTHGREDALVHWCQGKGLQAAPLSLQGREDEEALS